MSQLTFPGHELRERREQCGLTVLDVYRKIRVPIHVLQTLEQGDLQYLPPPCYTTGFLRSYCLFLELDPHPYVDTYRAFLRPQTRFLRRRVRTPYGPPRWLSDLIAWTAMCAVVALAWFAYAVVVRPNAEPGDQRVHADAQEDLRLPSSPLDTRR